MCIPTKIKTSLSLFILTLSLIACGGGGGSSSSPTVVGSTKTLSFVAEERGNTPSPQSFTIEIKNLDQYNGSLATVARYTTSIVSDINYDVFVDNGVVSVYPKSPSELGVGEFQGEVRVEVCYDDYQDFNIPCTNNIPGSPYSVIIDYKIVYGDFDNDGIKDNVDPDDDNDGVPDTEDAFPLDASESIDTDNDGIGNNEDPDDDGDRYSDTVDVFPLDPNEALDTDGDGQGDNSDLDIDGDGIANQSDAFPKDINLSVDTDGDGYPDSWNPGYPKESIYTYLILDEFPNDPECWLPSHGDASGDCDAGSSIPNFTPDWVVSDANGIVYFLSKETRNIHRWSTSDEMYLAPIFVGKPRVTGIKAGGVYFTDRSDGQYDFSPISMTYSPKLNYLYFGYSIGHLTFVDLSKASLLEESFNLVSSNRSKKYIFAFDDFLYSYTVEETGDYAQIWTRTFHNPSLVVGTIRGKYLGQPVWNPWNNKIYSLKNVFYGNTLDLIYSEWGRWLSGEAWPPVNDVTPPIVLSQDGLLVSFGSGGIYDAETFDWQTSIPEYDQALWLESGNFVVLRQEGESINLTVYDEFYNTTDNKSYTGTLVKFLKAGSSYVIVYDNSGELVIEKIEF